MLKGNVKITLYDKNGNVLQSQEKSNLVTDATKTILNYCSGANGGTAANALNEQMPVAEKLLGGLLLLDSPIENPDETIVTMPNTNWITGCANRTTDSSNDRRGSFNNRESGRIANGYKSVWDFNTSQAEGIISTIALTSLSCGDNPFGYHQGTALKTIYQSTDSSGNTYDVGRTIPLKYSKTDQLFYFLLQTSSTTPYTYEVCYCRIPFYEFNVEDFVYEVGTVVRTGNTLSTPNTILHYYSSIDFLGGYAYLGYDINGESVLKYKKLNLSSWECSEELTFSNASDYYTVNDGIWYFLGDRYIRAYSSNGTLLHTYDTKLDEDSPQCVKASTQMVNKSNGTVCVVTSDSQKSSGWVLFPDGRIDRIKNGGLWISKAFHIESDLLCFDRSLSDNSPYIYVTVKPDYLGTIFNLETPVEKGRSISMKVEYTLTNVTPS